MKLFYAKWRQATGGTEADADFTIFRASGAGRLFLEPFFAPEGFEGLDPDDMTLAQEIVVRVNGQFVFGDRRVVPSEQAVLGGFYTVRGYDESLVSGDNFLSVSAEYQYSFARALPASVEPGSLFGRPFRFQRQAPYGSPDWDLIVRGFTDIAYVSQNNQQSFESSETLVSIGLGVEGRLSSNVSARIDYGVALSEASNGVQTVDPGESRFHFLFSVQF